MSNYEHDLAKARRDIGALKVMIKRETHTLELRVRLAYRQFHVASLTEEEAEYAHVSETVSALIEDFGPLEDVCLLKANLEGRFHRLDEATRGLTMCPGLVDRPAARAILADIDFQQGRYAESRRALSALLEQTRTWDVLARFAHWESKLGDANEADRLYAEAEDQLTAKEMRSFAWLALQRGDLALSRGRLAIANLHYERAAAAFPGHWRTDEHVAALRVAEGKTGVAESLFRDVIIRCSKPELKQALGELLASVGRTEEARIWLEAASEAFLKSVQGGGVHYYHHLADLYADGLGEPAEAVRWARKDIAHRSNFATQSMLAWTLFKSGAIAEGLGWIQLALASGVRDAGIFSTAAALFRASGDESNGDLYERSAAAINPSRAHFHIH